jgi:RimJ/RimL family protein N-acetyltransferase
VLELDAIAGLVRDLTLVTDRLQVRRFASRDIDADAEHQLHPEVMRHIRAVPSREKALTDAREYCEPWKAREATWCTFAVVRTETNEYLGALVFRVDSVERQTVEFGYRFHPDHHGQGFATESCLALLKFLFEKACVRKVIALCAAENSASYSVMERLGMRREALFRRYSRLDGQWVDELVYGVFADEVEG